MSTWPIFPHTTNTLADNCLETGFFSILSTAHTITWGHIQLCHKQIYAHFKILLTNAPPPIPSPPHPIPPPPPPPPQPQNQSHHKESKCYILHWPSHPQAVAVSWSDFCLLRPQIWPLQSPRVPGGPLPLSAVASHCEHTWPWTLLLVHLSLNTTVISLISEHIHSTELYCQFIHLCTHK